LPPSHLRQPFSSGVATLDKKRITALGGIVCGTIRK
jgi:hypothetical protein